MNSDLSLWLFLLKLWPLLHCIPRQLMKQWNSYSIFSIVLFLFLINMSSSQTPEIWNSRFYVALTTLPTSTVPWNVNWPFLSLFTYIGHHIREHQILNSPRTLWCNRESALEIWDCHNPADYFQSELLCQLNLAKKI